MHVEARRQVAEEIHFLVLPEGPGDPLRVSSLHSGHFYLLLHPKLLLLTLSTSTCRKELKQRRAIIKEFTVPMLKVYEWGPEMGWCDGKGTSQPPS